jgi:hypothetical protein
MDIQERRRRREEARLRTRRRRRLAGAAALWGLVVVIAIAAAGDGSSSKKTTAKPRPPSPVELPRGGRSIFPRFRVVAYYGAPQAAQLGELGIGSPARAAAKLERQARPYVRPGRPVLPAFELLATTATSAPGDDGMYRSIQAPAIIARYLKAARKAHMLLILDIQPGHESFAAAVRRLEPFLVEPDVELALDPEWSLPPGHLPGKEIGSTDAADVNAAGAVLADIVKKDHLPQKLLLVHQFTPAMIRNRRALVQPPGVALTLNVDGVGDRPAKISKYGDLTRGERRFHSGFKLFYHEDTNLLSPGRVLALHPRPDVVVYE